MFFHLNRNCRILRKRCKMSIADLAEKLEISSQAITNFENGSKNCSIEVLDKLHTIFNISLDDLVYKDLSSSEE
ncbi:MAG: helix-turn-helix domain-containing protein [Roseburia sp.]|nr:helix-turn-helix domain-containing protein [Anaeroplasma bactoclasticum]MCM1196321.1 helix-turn-helix domain-containing protein [Roseburia sp.]